MSVDGLVSGLDTTSLISQLMTAEAAPQTALKSKVTESQSVITAYQGVNTRFAALQTAAAALADPDTWTTPVATSSAASVTATSASDATIGTIDFAVTSLAKSHSIATGTFANISDLSATWPATLTGTKNGANFSIPVATSTTAGVIDAINNATGADGKSLGLTATVVQTSPGAYRLQVSSKDSGLANAFTLDGFGATSIVRQGSDAQIDLGGGLTVNSSTNTFTDVLPGTTFTVSKLESAVTVGATVTAASMADKVQAMITAANAALTQAASQTAYNATTKTGGPLIGDATVRQLTSDTLGAINAIAGAGSPATAGIALDRNGQFTFDRGRFLDLMTQDPARAQALAGGVATTLSTVAKGASDSTSGSLTLAIQGRNSTIKELGDRISDWDTRLADRKAALQQQFTAMETALSSLKNQSSWLSGQIASLGSSS
jgi:flagellar hook-associated protein 2